MFPSVAVVSCDFIENGIISINIMATLLIIQELIIALLKVNDIVSVIVVINNIKTEEGQAPLRYNIDYCEITILLVSTKSSFSPSTTRR